MREAVYFDNPTDFCDFVRSRGTDASAKLGDRIEWCRIVHPQRPQDLAWVVFNPAPDRPDFLGTGVEPGLPIQAEISSSGQTLLCSFSSGPIPLVEHGFSRSLLECVSLVPWSGEFLGKASRGSVFFVVWDLSALATLIRDSLHLGNDRIQYGSLFSPTKEEAVIVKIDNPSYFLLQQCLEEKANAIAIYYQHPAGELFIRWGWEHPLSEWWQRSKSKREGLWIFFDLGPNYFHIEPVTWRDAYDLSDLQLDFNHRRIFAQTPATPPRFVVKLRLAPKTAAKAEPELWLLDSAGLAQLENTLQINDEEALKAWQIAAQSGSGSPTCEWIFVRELRTSSHRPRHHDFGGTAFARLQGITNLLLPCGFELQPPLRRDAYRELFELKPGFLTVLIPEAAVESGTGNERFLIVQINERLFEPLTSYVDYLVARETTLLEELMERSVFDFKHYFKAPKHPVFAPGKGEVENRRPGIQATDPAHGSPSGEPDEDLTNHSNDPKKKVERSFLELDESTLGALQKEELRLERELVQSGQSLDLWHELLLCKNQLGKLEDTLLCTIDVLWLSKGTAEEESLTETLKILTRECLDREFHRVRPEDHESMRRAAVFASLMDAPAPDQLDQWIGESTAFLRLHEGGLRSKERWLAWGLILSRNHDERQEIGLREDIRSRITGQGLGIEETPPFLRARIFLDRSFDPGDHNSAAETAISNLENLQSVVGQFRSPRLALVGRAVLARAYSKIGAPGRAQTMIAERNEEGDPCARAWEAMFQVEALRGVDQSRAEAILHSMEDLLMQADPETRKAVYDLRKTYQDRGDDNPAAFLARENRGRTYPHGPATEKGKLHELILLLENHLASGDESAAVAVMQTMMTLKETHLYNHQAKLPQFVEILVTGLEHFKWGEMGRALIPLYEEFSRNAPGYVTAPNNQFYGSILHSNLALGLLAFENLEAALRQVDLALKLVEANGGDLDFIDSAAALIKTVEQLPLTHRSGMLLSLMESIRNRFDLNYSPFLSSERLFAVVAKLIDQMAEAASSRDRLSLQQFRNYQLQDEFLILQRIQQETFLS